MELDFTRINNISVSDFTAEKQPHTDPTELQKGTAEYKNIPESQKMIQSDLIGLDGIGKLQRQADQQRLEIDRTAKIYKEYQRNTKISSQLQTEIIKGVKAGEDIYFLFLKACKVISLMTSNPIFYSQLESDIKSIYGEGLENPAPLRKELAETKERLYRLKEALKREPEHDNLVRIKRAITAHENKIKNIEDVIAHTESKEKPA